MTTLNLTILKTHLAAGQWVHAGDSVEVEESRANELVRNGLAALAGDAPEPEAKAAPAPSNKKKPEPENKAAQADLPADA